MAVLTASYSASWTRAQRDQAAFSVGSDVRATGFATSGFVVAGLGGTLPGAAAGSLVSRDIAAAGSTKPTSVTVLGIQGEKAPAVMNLRPDLLDRSPDQIPGLLDAQRPATAPAALTLPGHPHVLHAKVKTTALTDQGQVPNLGMTFSVAGTVGPSITGTTRIPMDGRVHDVTVDLGYTGEAAWPVALTGITMSYDNPEFLPTSEYDQDPDQRYLPTDASGIPGSWTWTCSASRPPTPPARAGRAADPGRHAGLAPRRGHRGPRGPGAARRREGPGLGGPRRVPARDRERPALRRLPGPPVRPVRRPGHRRRHDHLRRRGPGHRLRRLPRRHRPARRGHLAAVGDRDAAGPHPHRRRGPRAAHDARRGAALLADNATWRAATAAAHAEVTLGNNLEWWVRAQPGRADAVAAELRATGLPATVTSSADVLEGLVGNPVQAGIKVAFWLAAIAALTFAAIDFLVHLIGAVRERTTQNALVRALGASSRQVGVATAVGAGVPGRRRPVLRGRRRRAAGPPAGPGDHGLAGRRPTGAPGAGLRSLDPGRRAGGRGGGRAGPGGRRGHVRRAARRRRLVAAPRGGLT